MNILYYNTLCPKSRFIKLLFEEYKLEYDLRNEDFWKMRETFLKINPAGELPIVIIKNDNEMETICGSYAILEFLREKFGNNIFFTNDLYLNAEIRRILDWFLNKFSFEVTNPLIQEKVICFYRQQSSPNSNIIRYAKNNLAFHLEYANFLLNRNDWLANNQISIADFALAANISILDYLGEINWDEFKTVKNWYVLIKSRPSFRNLFNEIINGFSASKFYAELDF